MKVIAPRSGIEVLGQRGAAWGRLGGGDTRRRFPEADVHVHRLAMTPSSRATAASANRDPGKVPAKYRAWAARAGSRRRALHGKRMERRGCQRVVTSRAALSHAIYPAGSAEFLRCAACRARTARARAASTTSLQGGCACAQRRLARTGGIGRGVSGSAASVAFRRTAAARGDRAGARAGAGTDRLRRAGFRARATMRRSLRANPCSERGRQLCRVPICAIAMRAALRTSGSPSLSAASSTGSASMPPSSPSASAASLRTLLTG